MTAKQSTMETQNQDHRVCPHTMACMLDNPFQRLVQSPNQIVSPFIQPGDTAVDLGVDPGLRKDGVEAHLQELLAASPDAIEDGLTLVRREYPTAIGPVDLLCKDPGGATVAVEVKRRGEIDGVDVVQIRVEDNGPGFEEGAMSQVFDPYVTTKPKGTGLGLAIVKKLVEEHTFDPCFVTHVDAKLIPLAKLNPENPAVLEVVHDGCVPAPTGRSSAPSSTTARTGTRPSW